MIQRKTSVIKQKIFKVRQDPMAPLRDTDFDMDSDDQNDEEDKHHKTSIGDLILNYQASHLPFSSAKDSNYEHQYSTIGCFEVDSPNRYLFDDNGTKAEIPVVEVKILDVLFNNKVSSLIYIRDISQMIESQRKIRQEQFLESKVFYRVLEQPTSFIEGLGTVLKEKSQGQMNSETQSQLSRMQKIFDKLIRSYSDPTKRIESEDRFEIQI